MQLQRYSPESGALSWEDKAYPPLKEDRIKENPIHPLSLFMTPFLSLI